MKYILCLFFLLGSVQTSAESEVLKMMRISCNTSKSARACYNYANLLYNRQEYDDAKVYYKKGCKKGYAPSCKQKSSKRYINAVITKRKKKKNKSADLSIAEISVFKKNKIFMETTYKYCDKLSEVACAAEDCISSNNKKQCQKFQAHLVKTKMSSPHQLKTFAKECDSGRIDSCFILEYQTHMLNKL